MAVHKLIKYKIEIFKKTDDQSKSKIRNNNFIYNFIKIGN